MSPGSAEALPDDTGAIFVFFSNTFMAEGALVFKAHRLSAWTTDFHPNFIIIFQPGIVLLLSLLCIQIFVHFTDKV
jgi:hypothetical protein